MSATPTQLTQVVSEMVKPSTIFLLDDMVKTNHKFISDLYHSTQICKLNSYIFEQHSSFLKKLLIKIL